MKGARLRMGMVVRRQNEALTSKLVLDVCRAAELDWVSAREEGRRRHVEDTDKVRDPLHVVDGENHVQKRVTLEDRSKGWLFEGKPGSKAKFGKCQEYFRSLVDAARERDRRGLL
jgi:hypothetical protein